MTYPSLKTGASASRRGRDSIHVGDLAIHISKEYGTKLCIVRWKGKLPKRGTDESWYGIEFEEQIGDGTGFCEGRCYFEAREHHAAFVRRDDLHLAEDFYGRNMEIVQGCYPPLTDARILCGRFKGIQGHRNSCYLDATLFAMFTYSCAFDSILLRPPSKKDIPKYSEVQSVLRDEIVNPLRKFLFVKGEHVMRLRELIGSITKAPGFTTEEKDPEELFQALFVDTLRTEPFLHLSTGHKSFLHQLIVEKDHDLEIPTVQQLFDQSCVASGVKFKQVPAVLVLQMPRFGTKVRLYDMIQPSLALDITDAVLDGPRTCFVCGRLAEEECVACFKVDLGPGTTVFCKGCAERCHTHEKRTNHRPVKLEVSKVARAKLSSVPPPRVNMELFAVVCIETSHYVAFVKAGPGEDAPWCFFDSMADREGESEGFNIPEVTRHPEIPHWLAEEKIPDINKDAALPELTKRLLCDAYLCFYQNHDALMYR